MLCSVTWKRAIAYVGVALFKEIPLVSLSWLDKVLHGNSPADTDCEQTE